MHTSGDQGRLIVVGTPKLMNFGWKLCALGKFGGICLIYFQFQATIPA